MDRDRSGSRRRVERVLRILTPGTRVSRDGPGSRRQHESRNRRTGVVDPSSSDPVRFLTTLAGISRSPDLARRVAAELPGTTAGAVLSQTEVTPSGDADLLSVTATDSREGMTVRLANTFASEFTKFTEERARTENRERTCVDKKDQADRFAPRAKPTLPSTQTCFAGRPARDTGQAPSREHNGAAACRRSGADAATTEARRDPCGSLRPGARSGAGVPRGGTRPPCSIRTRGGRGSRGGRSSRACRSRRVGFVRPMSS